MTFMFIQYGTAWVPHEVTEIRLPSLPKTWCNQNNIQQENVDKVVSENHIYGEWFHKRSIHGLTWGQDSWLCHKWQKDQKGVPFHSLSMFFSNHPMTFLTGHQGLNLTKQSCHGRAQGAKFEDGGGDRGHSPRHQSGGRAPQLIVARDARAEWLGIARVITGVFQTSGSLWIRHGPTGFGGALADSCIEQPCFFWAHWFIYKFTERDKTMQNHCWTVAALRRILARHQKKLCNSL
jgi:hypothetical protein